MVECNVRMFFGMFVLMRTLMQRIGKVVTMMLLRASGKGTLDVLVYVIACYQQSLVRSIFTGEHGFGRVYN